MVGEALGSLLHGQNTDHTCTVVNTLGWDRMEVISLPPGEESKSPEKKRAKQDTESVQIDSCGNSLGMPDINVRMATFLVMDVH